MDGIKISQGLGLQDFDLIRVIGRGSYAKVLLVRLKKNDQIYAMKVVKKELVHDDEVSPLWGATGEDATGGDATGESHGVSWGWHPGRECHKRESHGDSIEVSATGARTTGGRATVAPRVGEPQSACHGLLCEFWFWLPGLYSFD